MCIRGAFYTISRDRSSKGLGWAQAPPGGNPVNYQ